MKINGNATISQVVNKLRALATEAKGEGGCHFHIDIESNSAEPVYEVEVQSINGVNPAAEASTPDTAFKSVEDQIAQLPK